MSKSDSINIALKFLCKRAYSQYQIEQKLLNKNIPEDEIKATISYLNQHGYISDRKFAKDLFDKYYNSPKYGFYRIKAKLLECGLLPNIVNDTLAEYNKQDDYKRALSLLQKTRMGSADQQKIARFLQNRGFDSSTTYQVLEHIFQRNCE